MIRGIVLVGIFMMSSLAQVMAIENIPASSYNETAPTNTDISNWNSGWTQPAVQPTGYSSTTGWNYVGTIGGNSGTYLGNGWVATATHVALGAFVLNGVSYPMVLNSARQVGNTDLLLFRITPFPALPPLPLRSTDPTAYFSHVVMIGYGHTDTTRIETWGADVVTQINEPITPMNSSYVTNDFLTITGTSSNGVRSVTNLYQVVNGDSGGPDFIFNSTTKTWELAGINEVNGTVTYTDGSPSQDFSGLIQIDTYTTQIAQIMAPVDNDVPAMPAWAMVTLAGFLLGAGTSLRAKPVEDSV